MDLNFYDINLKCYCSIQASRLENSQGRSTFIEIQITVPFIQILCIPQIKRAIEILYPKFEHSRKRPDRTFTLMELYAAPSDTRVLYLGDLQAEFYYHKQVFLLHMDFLAISTSDPCFYESVRRMQGKREIYRKL